MPLEDGGQVVDGTEDSGKGIAPSAGGILSYCIDNPLFLYYNGNWLLSECGIGAAENEEGFFTRGKGRVQ